MVTIRTVAGGRTLDHALVIAGDRARLTGETDLWHLYDTKANSVTLVDDVAGTIRTEKLDALRAQRRKTNAAALPHQLPRVRFVRAAETRTLQGAVARRAAIESGAYRRELWLAEHPAIPRGLFAMMHLSDKPSSPFAPMMRAVDEALASERGFPLADRATLGARVLVERTVTGIAQRDVPESLVTLPRGYKDVTPAAPNAQR